MARSLSEDFQAVWLLLSKVSFSRLEFWLILAGYDRKTRSFGSRVYVVYVMVFFSVWYFSVLTWLANSGKYLIEFLPMGGTLASATTLGALGILALILVEANLSVRSSPWVFSETDAYLLCQTPLDRRPIALMWFLKEWLISCILVGSTSMVIAYALVEASALRPLTAADLLYYLLAGTRMLSITIPLHLGLQALARAAGVVRLSEKGDCLWLNWVVPLLSTVFGVAYLYSAFMGGDFLPGWLLPVTLPVQAGLGASTFLPGVGLATLWMVVGLTCLWKQAGGMSLVRASQESKGQDRTRAAIWMGDSDLTQEVRQMRRLGSTRQPSRFLWGHGGFPIHSRDLVQSMRVWSITRLLAWVGIYSINLGILLAPDWEARVLLCLLWLLASSQQAVRRVRKSLSRWWLVNQLSVPIDRQFTLELALPLFGVSLAGLLALATGCLLDIPVPAYAWLILIPAVVGIGLVAIWEILRQCRTSDLSSGIVPDLTFMSIIVGACVLGVYMATAWFSAERSKMPVWGWISLVLTIGASLNYGLLAAIHQQVRK